ncbi:hypothetical protein ACFW0V_24100 [Micromonospora parva]|uniref:hypothetical protein n=1 Tax=Micromonospora parva TaxID=1464048 RepID=UPI00366BDCB2
MHQHRWHVDRQAPQCGPRRTAGGRHQYVQWFAAQPSYPGLGGGGHPGQHRPRSGGQHRDPQLLVAGQAAVAGQQDSPADRPPPAGADPAPHRALAEQPGHLRGGQHARLLEGEPVEGVGVVGGQHPNSLHRREAISPPDLGQFPSGRDGNCPRSTVLVDPRGVVGLSGPFNPAGGTDGGWVGHMEHRIDGRAVGGDDEVATLLARGGMIRNGALSRRQSIELMKEVVTSWT